MDASVKKNTFNFNQATIDALQYPFIRTFVAGSTAETEAYEYTLKQYTSRDLSDTDCMYYNRFVNAFRFENSEIRDFEFKIPYGYRGSVRRYDTDNSHPCYLKLYCKCGGHEISLNDITSDTTLEYVDLFSRVGPSYAANYSETSAKLYKVFTANPKPNVDNVISAHGPYWPQEAEEWIYRKRHKCYTRHKTERVLSYGFDVVCKSHTKCKKQDEDTEWRFSFSMAEIILINSWSKQQRIVYRILRMLWKFIKHKRKQMETQSCYKMSDLHLCTYYFKTLMLWAVDTRSSSSWDNVVESTRYILHKLILCFKLNHLPHYFIPSNNIIDHLESIDLTATIDAITYWYRNIAKLRDMTSSCAHEEMFSVLKSFVSMPNCIYNSIAIGRYFLHGSDDNFLFASRYYSKRTAIARNIAQLELGNTSKLTTILSGTLSMPKRNYSYLGYYEYRRDVYNKLSQEVNFITNCTSNIFSVDEREHSTTEYLHRLKSNISKNDWLKYISFHSRSQNTYRCNYFKRKNYSMDKIITYQRTAYQYYQSYFHLQHKKRKEIDSLSIFCQRKSDSSYNITSTIINPIDLGEYQEARVLEFWPEISPTVSLQWYLCKAYTANFYHTILQDLNNSEKLCDEIITTFNASTGNKLFAEYGFPVLLSAGMIKMYDKELQRILGLMALASFVIYDKNEGTINLPVCPYLFALYLKLRTYYDSEAFLMHENEDEILNEFEKRFYKFVKHGKECQQQAGYSEAAFETLKASSNQHLRFIFEPFSHNEAIADDLMMKSLAAD